MKIYEKDNKLYVDLTGYDENFDRYQNRFFYGKIKHPSNKFEWVSKNLLVLVFDDEAANDEEKYYLYVRLCDVFSSGRKAGAEIEESASNFLSRYYKYYEEKEQRRIRLKQREKELKDRVDKMTFNLNYTVKNGCYGCRHLTYFGDDCICEKTNNILDAKWESRYSYTKHMDILTYWPYPDKDCIWPKKLEEAKDAYNNRPRD